MSWFEQLTGFPEKNPKYVQKHLSVSKGVLTSTHSPQTLHCGFLHTPSLQELRDQCQDSASPPATLTLDEIVGDVTELHADPANAGACFQVASQFNLLEMASPKKTPEAGVGIYQFDHTQGPACAVACGAGTIYRNYFAKVNGQIGQSTHNQINCLQELASALHANLRMQNGYAFADEATLFRISETITHASSEVRNALRGALRIGLQQDTQVTLPDCSHRVHQIYGSALPVGYSDQPADLWEPFARLVLEASYEACLSCAIQLKCDQLYLTLLGGGVFGNRIEWITDAITRALHIHRHQNLQVHIVSYGSSRIEVQDLIKSFMQATS